MPPPPPPPPLELPQRYARLAAECGALLAAAKADGVNSGGIGGGGGRAAEAAGAHFTRQLAAFYGGGGGDSGGKAPLGESEEDARRAPDAERSPSSGLTPGRHARRVELLALLSAALWLLRVRVGEG